MPTPKAHAVPSPSPYPSLPLQHTHTSMTHTQQNTHRDHTSYSMSGVYVRRGTSVRGVCGVVLWVVSTSLSLRVWRDKSFLRDIVCLLWRTLLSCIEISFLFLPLLLLPFLYPFFFLYPTFSLSLLFYLFPSFFSICILYVSSSTSFYNVSLLFTMLFYISTSSTSIYLCLVLGGVGLGGCWVFIAF